MNDTESSALTRAICDRDIPRQLRAGMLRELNRYGASAFANLDTPIGINTTHFSRAEIPLAFQDSHEGRRWYCEKRKPGYEDVRCSGLLFFEKSLNTYREWQLEQGKAKVDPRVEDAIESDSPAKLRILLDLEGKSLGVRLLEAKPDGILVMDELGFMEAEAKAFCEAVLRCLDGDIPVLATVRAGDLGSSFLDRVRTHPKAELYNVSPERADDLYNRLYPIVEGWNEVLKC